jgi:hypothetical protein
LSDELEFAPPSGGLGDEPVRVEAPFVRAIFDDDQDRVVGLVIALTRDAKERPAIRTTRRSIESRVNVPFTYVILGAVAAFMYVVEVALQEPGVA